MSIAQAQSDNEQAGRIIARRLDDGRTEFGWQPTGGARVLPTARYFPADAQVPEGEQVGRWLNSSPVAIDGEAIGQINARLHADGRIEFAFTPTDRERILTDARYFPAAPRPNRWLRSTEMTIGPIVRYVAIAAGYWHSCAIRDTGEVECWGKNDRSQTNAPEGSFIAISAGWGHTCAIAETFETTVSSASAAGEIECWGILNDPINATPDGSFTAVSAARWHTCGLSESGAITCWGGNNWPPPHRDTPPPIAGSFSAVAAGQTRTCAIRESDSAIQCWGNHGDFTDTGRLDAPTGRFTAVSTSPGLHNCAIRESGAIECWGSNQNDGTLRQNDNYGHTEDRDGSFSAVAAGGQHNCAIRESDSAIECWVSSNAHQRGEAPAGRFTAIAAGLGHTCALRESGAIACWGLNDEGQTDVPTP